jgi:lipoprotein-anchoring transpeptidase ErfK/SrfK
VRGPARPLVAVAALLTAGLGASGCGGGEPAQPAARSTAASATAGAPAALAPSAPPAGAVTQAASRLLGGGAFPAARVGDVSLVARATASSVAVYPSPTATGPATALRSPLPSGAPLVFLVQERRGDRIRVLLPVRPNGSQGWVRAGDVELFQHDYRITVSTGRHELRVYRAGRVVMSAPVGLGTSTTPTPGGVFYVKELIEPRDPGGAYGPYAYGLSGYSDVLDEFLGGKGEIGIHGTNDPGSVGRSVSHGCIRLRNADITRLARMLPLGVPVQIER